ncbi:MAG TPA: potassium transporter, partial [Spirochaetia bacterium]|nr:potassium transporter [Spirochaetia bacterium]
MEQPFDPGITQKFDGAIRRIINPDGSFNVRRRGRRLSDLHLYQLLVRLSWPAFLLVILLTFLGITVAFTGLYFAVGLGGLQGIPDGTPLQRFLQVFFFSIQTLTTVGYG